MRLARPAFALLVLTASLLLPSGAVTAQQATPCDSSPDDPTDYSHVSEKGPYEAMAPEIVELESKIDGATIQMGLVRPAVPEGTRVPVIVHASVYYHALQTLSFVDCDGFLINNFVQHGYAIALLAVRGTADSGGCMNLMGPEERADIDQAITWLGTQPWSSGSVGMWGKSYDGATQWMAAAFGNPHLKTIVPASGVPDLFTLMYGAGTPDWRGPAILSDIYYVQSAAFYAPGRSTEHTAEVLACPEYATGTAASLYGGATGLMDPLGYWEERRYTKDIVDKYRGSVFLVQGLQDWNVNPGQQFPWIEKLEEEGVAVKYMLGQWGHSWPDEVSRPHLRLDFADILLDWYERWLKGDEESPIDPKAQVEDNTGVWRNSSEWPPANGEELRLWLDPDDALSTKPSDQTATEVLGPDPGRIQNTQVGFSNPLADRCAPGCALFETTAFDEPFRIAGLPKLSLSVTPAGPGGGLSVFLYRVSETGAQSRIGWGQVNLGFSEPGVPRPVSPGQRMQVELDLQPLDAVVPAGSKLRLVVGQGAAWNRLPTVPNYPIQLHEGAKSSWLNVFNVQPQAGDFFLPPARS